MKKLLQKDKAMEELKALVIHYEAILNRDSTNTGTPTAQTPPGKDRHIPNSRRSTGKQKGGQPGHSRHILEAPPEEQINDAIEYFLEKGEACPYCGSENLRFTGKYEDDEHRKRLYE